MYGGSIYNFPRSVTQGPLSIATCPRFVMQKDAVSWPEGGAASQYSVFIGRKCH